MMGVPTPSRAPAPVAPLPSRGLPQSVHFSVAIDTMSNQWFREQGLVSLTGRYLALRY